MQMWQKNLEDFFDAIPFSEFLVEWNFLSNSSSKKAHLRKYC